MDWYSCYLQIHWLFQYPPNSRIDEFEYWKMELFKLLESLQWLWPSNLTCHIFTAIDLCMEWIPTAHTCFISLKFWIVVMHIKQVLGRRIELLMASYWLLSRRWYEEDGGELQSCPAPVGGQHDQCLPGRGDESCTELVDGLEYCIGTPASEPLSSSPTRIS